MSFRDLVDSALGTCLDVFGDDDVSYMAHGGSPVPITGIFSDRWVEIDPQTNAKVSTQMPNLGIRLSDFAAKPAQKDQLIVRSKSYQVAEVIEDGEGTAILLLHEL